MREIEDIILNNVLHLDGTSLQIFDNLYDDETQSRG